MLSPEPDQYPKAPAVISPVEVPSVIIRSLSGEITAAATISKGADGKQVVVDGMTPEVKAFFESQGWLPPDSNIPVINGPGDENEPKYVWAVRATLDKDWNLLREWVLVPAEG